MCRSALLCLSLLLVPAAAITLRTTPVEKVTQLLTDLKTQIEEEGKAEATTYDEFACFCRDTTTAKSTSITTGRDNINGFSAAIESKTAKHAEDTTDLRERQGKQEEKTAQLADEEARLVKERESYEAVAADLAKALSSLEKAIGSLTAAKPASFLEIQSELEKSLVFADALNLKLPDAKRNAMSAFLQVDPTDPTYKYHSEGILKTLSDLQTEFQGRKQEADDEWGKTKLTIESSIQAMKDFMTENQAAMDGLEASILTLNGEIAEARTSLVEAEGLLKDDQAYLKDLTQRCETSAQEWDQRSQLRAGEIEALSGALKIISGDVTALDTAVNQRAMLLSKNTRVQKGDKKTSTVVSFFQAKTQKSFSAKDRQAKVAALLAEAGNRLGSATLSTLATRTAGDPFGKVKQLIQDLIERLLSEATAEATKKGFCDEELGKAYKERDFRAEETTALDNTLEQLELKEDELETEITFLTGAIQDLNHDLGNATELRTTEKEENLKRISDAKEGAKTVQLAIDILQKFYKEATKAGALLQASPVDEDTSGPGFSGAYSGKQAASKGIIGMLHVIKTDFERTFRTTDAAEKKAHADFVEFDRTARSDISGKEKKKELDEFDLKTTKTTITQKMQDLEVAQQRLDAALKVVEGLKPTCIDTGMSYEDRLAKREEEIAALKRALCILDEQKVEAECQ